jgi:hypothetical protein
MNPQIAVELILAAGAALLLTRDVRRAWRDPLRRPVTLLMASLVTGWRMAPRRNRNRPLCRGQLLAALGLGMEQSTTATELLATADAMGLVAVGLFVLSNRREPRPWRADGLTHYERRAVQRRKA